MAFKANVSLRIETDERGLVYLSIIDDKANHPREHLARVDLDFQHLGSLAHFLTEASKAAVECEPKVLEMQRMKAELNVPVTGGVHA